MKSLLAGKRIVFGVTGSIAAFKVAGWVSHLAKEEALVSVIMSEPAKKFIAPLTFAALSGEKVYESMFADDMSEPMAHIELAQTASLIVIAPASAQTIARLAHGMADDLLGATVLATRAPVIICPAMNSQMYLHRVTQENISRLRSLGYFVIDPDSGMMACKDDGPGRLVEWENALEVILKSLSDKTLTGQRILITAGPTKETIDPARFLSNRSSGKMGYALARCAFRAGAEVLLVSGPTELKCPFGVERIEVNTAEEMYHAVMEKSSDASIIIKSAAVSDFRPVVSHSEKIKKDRVQTSLDLTANPDILYELGQRVDRNKKILVGFAAESENIEAEARKKLIRKNLDLIAVNNIKEMQSGFAVDTNKVTLIDREKTIHLPLTSKEETAALIIESVVAILREKTN